VRGSAEAVKAEILCIVARQAQRAPPDQARAQKRRRFDRIAGREWKAIRCVGKHMRRKTAVAPVTRKQRRVT
jgi:hypothetical protein